MWDFIILRWFFTFRILQVCSHKCYVDLLEALLSLEKFLIYILLTEIFDENIEMTSLDNVQRQLPRHVLQKSLFSKVLQNLPESTCVVVSFLVKLKVAVFLSTPVNGCFWMYSDWK